jgi:hypothetical protein
VTTIARLEYRRLGVQLCQHEEPSILLKSETQIRPDFRSNHPLLIYVCNRAI